MTTDQILDLSNEDFIEYMKSFKAHQGKKTNLQKIGMPFTRGCISLVDRTGQIERQQNFWKRSERNLIARAWEKEICKLNGRYRIEVKFTEHEQ